MPSEGILSLSGQYSFEWVFYKLTRFLFTLFQTCKHNKFQHDILKYFQKTFDQMTLHRGLDEENEGFNLSNKMVKRQKTDEWEKTGRHLTSIDWEQFRAGFFCK